MQHGGLQQAQPDGAGEQPSGGVAAVRGRQQGGDSGALPWQVSRGVQVLARRQDGGGAGQGKLEVPAPHAAAPCLPNAPAHSQEPLENA